jgi:cobalt-zinc-cadmium efflux system membrane fusion protein
MNRGLILILLLTAGLAACGGSRTSGEASAEPEIAHAHDEHGKDDEAPAQGPNGGRLLVDGDLELELALLERGGRPEFRAWTRKGGQLASPQTVSLEVELVRLGGVVDRLGFVPVGDYLRSEKPVAEPHSFEVKVRATHAGETYAWEYDSYEGRTTIAAAAAKEAGIEAGPVGPGTIDETLKLYGAIVPDATRVREVRARFPGLIRRVLKNAGDTVKAGETLALVESNESLQAYAVTAPLAGVVTQQHAGAGEQAEAQTLFEVSDFSTVWAEFRVFARDRARLRVGQAIKVSDEHDASVNAEIAYIAPQSSPETQSVSIRVVLDNRGARWTPGQFVEGQVSVAQSPVERVLPLSALQRIGDSTVAFVQVGEIYEWRALELGRRDAEKVEVLDGVAPGMRVVTRNSYLIKADIEKSGAGHDH